jgi:alpha-1,6-mannosyltransferase
VKTLHITNAYHAASGGIRTFYRALLATANQQHRLMRLVVPGAADAVEEVGACGRIYHVAARPAPAFDRRYRVILPNAYLPPAASALGRILDAEQPDLVEICDKYSVFYLAALLRKDWLPSVRRPLLVGLSAERMDDNLRAYVGAGRLSTGFARWYLRHIYGPPFDVHLANSEYTADELRRVLWDRHPGFIRVCPMGVAAAGYGPRHRDERLRRSLLERAGGRKRSTLLLYVGRLSPEKNVHLLIATLARLARRTHAGSTAAHDYRLVVVGDGPLRDALQAAAMSQAPNRVLFTGAIEGVERLRRYYASADVFVHPNPREPFGIAPLEAMASGVPVVLPNAGGILTYASRENAWLAAPDAESFALAIRSAVETPEPVRIVAARATAQAYDWPVVAERWFTTYDSLIDEWRAQSRRLAS